MQEGKGLANGMMLEPDTVGGGLHFNRSNRFDLNGEQVQESIKYSPAYSSDSFYFFTYTCSFGLIRMLNSASLRSSVGCLCPEYTEYQTI